MSAPKFNLQPLQDYAELLHREGFEIIFYPNDDMSSGLISATWFLFSINGKIGYVQFDRSRGFSFSSQHKPCKEFGTGFGIHQDIWEPLVRHAFDTFVFAPGWAYGPCSGSKKFEAIKKYESLNEYMKRETILKYEYLTFDENQQSDSVIKKLLPL